MIKWVKTAAVILICAALAGCGGKKDGTAASPQQKQTVEQTLQDQIAEEDGQSQAHTDGQAQSQTDGQAKGQTGRGDDLQNQNGQPETSDGKNDAGQSAAADSAAGRTGIDVDLTQLSSTMVYSEVYNMMTVPEDYIGKKVKMTGAFSVYHDEQQDINYYACIIQDATACCSQGMEFVLTDSYTYPDDYPAEGEEVTVVGTFDTYEEGEYTYCTLRNAELAN